MSPVEILLIGLPACLIMGIPVFISLGVVSLLALLRTNVPLVIIPQTIYEGMDQFPLLAIPCFILAGTIMEKTGLTEDIIVVVQKVVGRMKGGLGVATILSCMFFSAVSGSGPGTVAAVGSLMIPAMKRRGYGADYAGAVSSSGGTLGILIPPSNPMIIYGVIANVSISGLFIAGFFPGFIIGFAHCFVAYYVARRFNFGGTAERFEWVDFLKTIWQSKFALAAPFVILGGIYGGIFTPVEASIIAVVYALVVGGIVYRKLSLSLFYDCLKITSETFGPLAMLIGTSLVFGKLMTMYRVPLMLTDLLSSVSQNWFVVTLIIIGFLFILGMFMETLSTIMILTPVLLPVITKLGMDPIHFGIIFVVTNEIAFLTPPLGVNLFVAMQLADVPLERLSLHVIPHIIAIVLCLLVIAYFPQISIWLPHLLGMGAM
ncbi:MAG: TRAP transporter large permease [Deltaproteobacteria bacterium]|nr:TRAP transporter large permease [Deltaproteobacteria bacterium]MBW1963005.1 TRAP transporter large permease [Deltaproteobacteria bacterium]MBW2151606.1 TRAP transporter large permease [Deltaproteobacteria bacterium]